jgi:heat shock protein HtpX
MRTGGTPAACVEHAGARDEERHMLGKWAKSFILLAALGGLLMLIGGLIGGRGGVLIALVIAVAINFYSWFNSDKLAIRMARAKPMEESEYPQVYAIVRGLAQQAGQPMPRLYISPSPQLNAFATGRGPDHAAVCVNQGLYDALTPEELEGVLGHELQHVYNRDILIGSIAATIAMAITGLAMMARFAAIFGGGGRDGEGGNPFALLAMAILAPIAATFIQLAVTRSRESLADHTGAELTGKPLALASALAKLESGNSDPQRMRMGGTPAETNGAMQHMYITAPFGGRAASKLFRSHPPTAERIAALEEQARDMGQLGPGQSIYG